MPRAVLHGCNLMRRTYNASPHGRGVGARMCRRRRGHIHAIRCGCKLSISLRSRFFCAFFLARKKGPKKVLIILRCKILPQNRERFIKRNGIVTYFALFLLRQLLEMRCRLKRFTYTSQNEAIAPQTTCGLLTYTVLKAFASRDPCLCRGYPMW